MPSARHHREAQRLADAAASLTRAAHETDASAVGLALASALTSLAYSELAPRVRVGTRPPVRHEHRTVRTVDLTPPSSPPLADVDLQQLFTDIVMCAPSAATHPTPSEAYLTIRVPELVEVIAHGLARLGYRVVHIHG